MLETIEVETAAKPNAAVIWLHGLGADGHDFEPIVPEIVRRGERAWRFVFPNAPVRPVTINGGMPMRAWYDLKGLDRKTAEDVAGFRDTDAQVRQLIAREGERGIPARRIVLAGFSQGAAVSLVHRCRVSRKAWRESWRCPATCRGKAPFSAERSASNNATPIFMAHGRADNVLPMSLGVQSRDFLKAARVFGRVARLSHGARGVRRRGRGYSRILVPRFAITQPAILFGAWVQVTDRVTGTKLTSQPIFERDRQWQHQCQKNARSSVLRRNGLVQRWKRPWRGPRPRSRPCARPRTC